MNTSWRTACCEFRLVELQYWTHSTAPLCTQLILVPPGRSESKQKSCKQAFTSIYPLPREAGHHVSHRLKSLGNLLVMSLIFSVVSSNHKQIIGQTFLICFCLGGFHSGTTMQPFAQLAAPKPLAAEPHGRGWTLSASLVPKRALRTPSDWPISTSSFGSQESRVPQAFSAVHAWHATSRTVFSMCRCMAGTMTGSRSIPKLADGVVLPCN
jgi:hypothetical protein